MALQPREKKMLKVLGVVAGVAAIALFFVYKPKKAEEPPNPAALVEETPAETPTASGSSAPRSGGSSGGGGGGRRGGGGGSSSSAESTAKVDLTTLEQHNSPSDCWVVIGDEVYNITGFIENYPQQSDSASQYCGTIGFEAGFLGEAANLKGSIKQVSSLVGKF